jgi:S1-C subfamily serine protease
MDAPAALPTRRSRFQFSIATLLIAMTLAAIVLAYVDWTPPLDKQFLGVAVYPEGDALVYDVLPGTVAAKIGIERGDRLVAINDIEVTDFQSLRHQLARYQVGSNVMLRVRRQGVEFMLGPFPIGRRPDSIPAASP